MQNHSKRRISFPSAVLTALTTSLTLGVAPSVPAWANESRGTSLNPLASVESGESGELGSGLARSALAVPEGTDRFTPTLSSLDPSTQDRGSSDRPSFPVAFGDPLPSSPSHSQPFYPAISHPATSHPATFYPATFYPEPSHPATSHPATFYPEPSHFATIVTASPATDSPLLAQEPGETLLNPLIAQDGVEAIEENNFPELPEPETPELETPETPELETPGLPAPQTPPGLPDVPTLTLPSGGSDRPQVPGSNGSSSPNDPRVLVSEVQVRGMEGHPEEEILREAVFNAVELRAGQPTTRSTLQNDLNAIFATGYFSNVRFVPEDTPLGVRVTFVVEPNPTFNAVVTEGTRVLPPDLVEEIFAPQYGQILNLQNLQDGVQEINQWYQDNGYVLAQVVDASQIAQDGTVTLVIAEGEIAAIEVRFLNEAGDPVDENGEPISGKTKSYIVTREFSLKPGDIFNRNQAETDLQRVFGLGLFEDVRLSLDPSPEDATKVVVVANVIEGSSGSIGAGAGLSSDTGLFGSISYQQQNFRGRNYIIGTELTLGEDALLFDVNFTNPWIKDDPYRTSYTVNAFRRRSISLVFDEGDRDVDLPNGDTPRIVRTGGGIRFNRPLSRDVYNPSVWTASLGLQYQRVRIEDENGDPSPQDELGNFLTFSEEDSDDLITLGFGLSRDLRNSRVQATAGSLARINMDQSIPFGNGSILMNRIRASYSYYIPLRFLRFKKGCQEANPSPADCPQTLAFNVQAGTVFGDLPPYEAFLLGGSNSVRGYEEGSVGAGRSFVQATAEYRFPLFSIIGGALFADVGTDLGTGDDVPGKPAEIREKPGSGFGVGLGVRVRSPIGAIRVDYGLNDQGDTRFHFGIGERF